MQARSILENLFIERCANEGNCIAHGDGKTIFVKGTLPGETVNVVILRDKKNWVEAETLEVIHPSPERQTPFCRHFGYCGGCQWQHMKYAAQLKYKQQAVMDTLLHIGKIAAEEQLPIIASDEDRWYRNKLEYTFSDREWLPEEAWQKNSKHEINSALGYHLPGRFDRVFDVKTCYLQPDIGNEIRNSVKKFTAENDYDYFNLKRQTGLMRNLIIRISTLQEIMVVVVFTKNDKQKIVQLMNFLTEKFPQITSLQYIINPKRNDTIYDLETITFAGRDFITEKLGRLVFKISAKSFFQTNTRQAEKLYDCVKAFADLSGTEIVYDLYTGTGSIALYLANSAKKIIGVEQVVQAVEDAKENAQLNGISNTKFFSSAIEDWLHEDHDEKPDLVIVDPPRAGLHEKVIAGLLALSPVKIIYVSCNVATQARDLQKLSEKYNLKKIRPFDLFPQTHHVENVALLEMKS